MGKLHLTVAVGVLLAAFGASAAIEAVSPADGEVVQLLKAPHIDYLKLSSEERIKEQDDPVVRKKLFAAGDSALPVVLSWKGTGRVCQLEIVPEGGKAEVFAFTNGETMARLANLEVAKRYRWTVSSSGESVSRQFTTADMPPRILHAQGVGNFRDLGGWRTVGGKRVRQNMILRSAGLRFSARAVGKTMFTPRYEPGKQRVTVEGIATLRDEFEIRTDLELRNNRECACMTGTLLGDGVIWRHIPFVAYDFIDNMATGKEKFHDIFEIFTDRANYPVLMHCSGGRDRTGTVAFLLNGVLGVNEDDLRRDWEASSFADPSLKFSSGRLERLFAYLAKLPGRTTQERIEAYFRSCGITSAQISAFKSIMLEPVAASH